MRREEDKALWDLLGRADRPRVSAFFARDVVRRLREQPSPFDRFRATISRYWLVPASAVAAALILAAVVMRSPISRPATSENFPEVVAKIDPQDYDVVADLDVLIASDETSLWDENQTL